MAIRQRRRKKTIQRSSGKRGGRINRLVRLFRCGFFLLALLTVSLCGLYFFGPQAAKETIEQGSIHLINHLRQQEWMPKPLLTALDQAHEGISMREGLGVDGGELGYDGGPLLAGLPKSQLPTRVLRNDALVNLFDERNRQSRCLAVRLSAPQGSSPVKRTAVEHLRVDPRVPNLRTGQMTDGPWSAQPLLPPEWLYSSLGEALVNDIRLPTFSVPMRQHFAEAGWTLLMREIAVNYPARFGEVWLYVGPVFGPDNRRLASGIPIPEQFYAIVFDITTEGWLRAIAFLLTHEQPPESLDQCITSIEAIETLTGLTFLPELNQAAYNSLRTWVSPKLW
ncbi:MAG: DNA/RNA non-specific endonuclease [Coraliomargaritaceae bacterium]